MIVSKHRRITRFGRIAIAVLAVVTPSALGQSLFTRPVVAPLSITGELDPSGPLRQVSMLAIAPPQPRTFKVHDLVTIIIDESSSSSSKQSLKTKKESDATVEFKALLDPLQLLETRLRAGEISNLDLIDSEAELEFKGDGRYTRTDRFTARITAEVIDVKPNGTLVLEARKRIERDKEITEIVLTGLCRLDDITLSNTVLSSQLANLVVIQHNEGAVKDAAKKGMITNLLDTIFNF